MFINIEAKGENEKPKEELEEVNVNLYEMVKKCVISGTESLDTVNELLDLNVNLYEGEKLLKKRTRANSML